MAPEREDRVVLQADAHHHDTSVHRCHLQGLLDETGPATALDDHGRAPCRWPRRPRPRPGPRCGSNGGAGPEAGGKVASQGRGLAHDHGLDARSPPPRPPRPGRWGRRPVPPPGPRASPHPAGRRGARWPGAPRAVARRRCTDAGSSKSSSARTVTNSAKPPGRSRPMSWNCAQWSARPRVQKAQRPHPRRGAPPRLCPSASGRGRPPRPHDATSPAIS